MTWPLILRGMALPGMLAMTSMVLKKAPKELGLKITLISPESPGRTGRLSQDTEVQPQVVRMSRMSRGTLPVLVKRKAASRSVL